MWKSKLIDLIIPLVLILGCMYLLLSGIDGEVKVILSLSAGWAFRAGVIKVK